MILVLASAFAAWIVFVRDRDRYAENPKIGIGLLAAIVAWGLLDEGMTLLQRRRANRRAVEVGPTGITMFDGERQRWEVAWNDVERIVLLSYWPSPSWNSASLLIRTTSGVQHRIPIASSASGEIPDRAVLLAQIEHESSRKIEIRHWPRRHSARTTR